MGFLKPKAPAVTVVKPEPAPVIDDDAVRKEAERTAKRNRSMRGASDTILRRTGGLGGAMRAQVGG